MRRLVTFLLPVLVTTACGAQQAAESAALVQPPSSLVQPALDRVAQAGSGVDLNRWKGSSTFREEVDQNLASMQKDLQTALPPLLIAADAAPNSASAALPVLLNLDALYSVLLRVTLASRSSAPRDENAALEQAANVLDGARRTLGDAVLAAAQRAEQQLSELRQQNAAAQVQAQPEPPAAATPKIKKKAGKTSAAR